MPAKLRAPAALSVAAAALFALSACFLAPSPAAPSAAPAGTELADTTWAGTDSDGDDWSYTFQADGTVAVSLNGESYDDDSDVWTASGAEVVITVNGGDRFGAIIHTGRFRGLDEPMNLDVQTTVGDRTWTITIDRQE